MRIFKQHYSGKDGKKKQSAKYYVELKDHLSIRRRIPGFKDRKLTAEMGRKIENLISLKSMNQPLDHELIRWMETITTDLKQRLSKFGIISKSLAQIATMSTHLDEFKEYLRVVKNDTTRYVRENSARIQAILDDCGFIYISDFSTTKLTRFLDKLQKDGVAIRTRNHYLTAFKGFCRWLLVDGRMTENVFEYVARLNPNSDIRRERRALSDEDFSLLVETTKKQEAMNGLTGEDRAILYQTAAYSGLRALELASLIERSFNFTSSPQTVTVEAAHSKHRKRDVLPLHQDLAAELISWIGKKEEKQTQQSNRILSINSSDDEDMKLWPGKWAKDRRAGKMLKKDLSSAGIPHIDDNGKVFDFHSLRHHFVTSLGRAGVPLTVAQSLARHSDPKLTSSIYTHLALHDLSSAISILPSFPKSMNESGKAQA